MRAFDVLAALALLSRLPVPIDHAKAGERGARAAWAYPAAGALLGGLSGGALWTLMALGVAPGPAAALGLVASALLTGALHEDGLADAADGLGAGRDRDRALAIMRDSQIGAYGATALGLSLLARWSALAAIAAVDSGAAAAACVAAGGLSRGVMALGLWRYPSARSDGLAAAQGRAPGWAAALAATLAALGLGAVAVSGGAPIHGVFLAAAAALAAAGLFLRHAAARLGGVTGDVLGAAQQIAEAAFLAGMTAALSTAAAQ
ncbi:MAG: adenosylcobinamide-GDP ribazoletransferase [Pseudomonadota bacterium]